MLQARDFARWSLVVGFLTVGLARPVRAQDPLTVAPDNYKKVFENEHVRVLDVRYKPGAKVAMHSHPDHVGYVISGEKVKVTSADGKTKDMECKPSEVKWMKAESHAVENTGAVEFHVIVFELKDAPAAAPPPKSPEPDPTKVASDSYKALFENERVRVLDVHAKPGAKIPMHAHPAYAVYAFTDQKAKFTGPDDKAAERLLKAGEAAWSPAESHAVENTGAAEIHVLVVEVKGGAPKPAEKTEKK